MLGIVHPHFISSLLTCIELFGQANCPKFFVVMLIDVDVSVLLLQACKFFSVKNSLLAHRE